MTKTKTKKPSARRRRKPAPTPRKRRTKAELDPQVLDRVLTVVRVGAGKREAATQAGISPETLRAYEKRGRAAALIPEADRTAEEATFATFFLELSQAQNSIMVYCLEKLKKHGATDWRALAFLLEKLYPKRFGKRVDVGLEHSGTVETVHDLSRLTEDELFALRALKKKLTEGKDDDE